MTMKISQRHPPIVFAEKKSAQKNITDKYKEHATKEIFGEETLVDAHKDKLCRIPYSVFRRSTQNIRLWDFAASTNPSKSTQCAASRSTNSLPLNLELNLGKP